MNRDALARIGMLFPRAPGEANHMALAAAAQHPDKRDDLRRLYKLNTAEDIEGFRRDLVARLRDEMVHSEAHTAVMSGEHCSSRLINFSEITFLKTFLSELFEKITVVLYIRRQDEFLLSSYSTDVKSGSLKRLTLPDQAEIEKRYNYMALLRRWSEVFGRENILCRRYHGEFFINGDVVDDFCASIGIPGAPMMADFRRTARVNESLDADACEFLRRFNSYLPRHTADGINAARGKIEVMLSQISRGPFLGLTESQKSELMATVEQTNAEVADEFFGGQLPPPGDPLFGRATAGRARTQQSDLTIERAMEIFAQLWAIKQEQVIELEQRARKLKDRVTSRRAG